MGEGRGPGVGSPVSLQLLLLRGVDKETGTEEKETGTSVSALGPGVRVVRTMAMMPVLTPVVALVSSTDIDGPTLAGLAAVAIITRRS